MLRWLSSPDNNATRLSYYLLQLLRVVLDFTDNRHIQPFLRQAVHAEIDKINITHFTASILDSLSYDSHHQAILNAIVSQLTLLLNKPITRTFISVQIVRWFKCEHLIKKRLLPTNWLGEHSADLISNVVNSILDDIGQNSIHALRKHIDRLTHYLITRLKEDPKMANEALEIKTYLKNDKVLKSYVRELWGDMYTWLTADFANDSWLLYTRVAESSLCLEENPIVRL